MYMKTRNVWILAALLCGQIGVQAQEALPKEVKVGKERIKARHEICLPQIDDYQLLKCDFHIHTIFPMVLCGLRFVYRRHGKKDWTPLQ